MVLVVGGSFLFIEKPYILHTFATLDPQGKDPTFGFFGGPRPTAPNLTVSSLGSSAVLVLIAEFLDPKKAASSVMVHYISIYLP